MRSAVGVTERSIHVKVIIIPKAERFLKVVQDYLQCVILKRGEPDTRSGILWRLNSLEDLLTCG
ncbi:hypothetical protein GF348_03365 [candidate division KSB3 bacterium]|nr:hypothetical protein [candidate division KSB3 bacterium]